MVQTSARALQTRLDGSEPRYWPIGNYGVIGDCRTAALIAPNGSVDWLCLPHFDSPATLCRLLDADQGGFFQIRPQQPCDSTMSYVPATNMLETTFTTDNGQAKTLDFMPIRKRRAQPHVLSMLADVAPTTTHSERAHLEREIGNDVAAAHRIDRIVTCASGELTMEINVKLTPNYARRHVRLALRVTRPHTIAATLYDDDNHFYVFVARPLPGSAAAGAPSAFATSVVEGRFQALVHLRAGQRIGVALNFARDEREAQDLLDRLLVRDFDDDAAETLNYWQNWSDQCAYDGPYAQEVLRSALMLKLCTFEPTGAIVAAPTTSLPEDIGGERNWDYRYTWLRDSSFTLQALGVLGYHSEARDFFHYLHDLGFRNGNDIRVLYTLRGESNGATTEHELTDLDGYQASRPVRIGNGAATQRQMDIYGEVADAALRYAQALGYCKGERVRESPRDLRELVSVVADFVADHWRDLDRGIWEVRGPERAFVYSRVMCWVALDRAVQMTRDHVDQARVARWADEARSLRDDIEANGYSDTLRSFTQAYGVDAVDAANFRLALVQYLSPTDQRLRDTVTTTGRILSSGGGLIYRYRPVGDHDGASDASPSTDDGLSGKEGAFLACAFWYVSTLALMGQVDEARERFQQLLQYASPLGLFSEEIDSTSGALLGNFPQAYTHIGLINAAYYLRLAEDHPGQMPSADDPAS